MKFTQTMKKIVDRTTSEGKASAVHFLHFKFTDQLVEAFKNKNNIIQIGIDHDAYGHFKYSFRKSKK